MLLARISLTLSHHFSLSFIASGRSSGLHLVSSQSCCMYVRTGRPAFAWSYVGVHRSTSLMGLSLLLQQCPACLVRLTWIVFVMGGRWQYSWCLVACCRQDLFNIARNILVSYESPFFSLSLYRHATNKGMDSYRLAIAHMEVRLDLATRLKILNNAVYISFHTNVLGKDMNLFFLLPAIGK